MPIPSKGEALQRIHVLAESEAVEIGDRALDDAGALGYYREDVCDMLYELEEVDCEKIAPGKHRNDPVATFRTTFLPRRHEEDDLPPDDLFVEVAIRDRNLFVLACKLYGSPR